MKRLLSLLSPLGFIVTPQQMPKQDDNYSISDNNDNTDNKNSDVKSKLNKLILEIPDRRVHDDLYNTLLIELDDEKLMDENNNTKAITRIDRRRSIIKIRQH